MSVTELLEVLMIFTGEGLEWTKLRAALGHRFAAPRSWASAGRVVRRALIVATVGFVLQAQAQVGDSYKVQPPTLAAPGRGSLAGSLSHTAFGPGDVERGSMTLPSPYVAPEERGPLLVRVFPSYSPEAGISEWGMGWGTELALRRWRDSGDLDYETDDLSGVFGPCKRGADGNWYPSGLGQLVRIEPSGLGFVALTSDGTRWRFGQRARVETPNGTSLTGSFAWALDEVETATGRKAALTYAANASGRLFLTQVDYGGVGNAYQHRITIAYAPIDRTFTDYRAGFALTLDRRVSGVTVWNWSAAAGWERRLSFVPTYQQDDVGPAFYLSSVVQTFASGKQAPVIQYTYELSSEALSRAELRRNFKLDTLLDQYGAWSVLPDYATQTDANMDGLADFELASDNSLVVQSPYGFAVKPLPPESDAALAQCRPSPSPWNLPRTLAAMRAASDELQVVALAPSSTTTQLELCNREGEAVYRTTLEGHWDLGPATRLVDLNRDHQPDFIQVWIDGYAVISNTSTPTGYAFGSPVTGMLDAVVDLSGVWLQDLNGDGLPDIITRAGSALAVFLNQGHFAFERTARLFDLRNDTGQLFDPSAFRFTWLDADGDGLADLVLSTSTDALLFRNTGEGFVPVPVGGKPSIFVDWAQPLFLDLSGSGNAEVTFILQDQAYALALNGPGTGLLKTADDGQGSRLTFTWDRAPAAPGLRARQAVLSSVRSDSLGTGPLTTSYAYAAPTVHRRGKYLVGYDQVSATTPSAVETATFLNGDDFSGLPLTSRKHDANAPSVDQVEWRSYENATYQGLPWKRLKSHVAGVQSADGKETASERTDYVDFLAEVCPRTVRHEGASGTLVTVSDRANVPGLGAALHCLPSRVDTLGFAEGGAKDFEHTALIGRNDVGQVTSVQSQAAAETLTIQTATYDAEFKLATLSSPATGTTTFVYEPGTRLLREIRAPDGVVTQALEREALTDAVRRIRIDRGADPYEQYFRYDDFERLAQRWNNLGDAAEQRPNEKLSYRWATSTTPASVFSTILVDSRTPDLPLLRRVAGALNSGVTRNAVDYLTAAGDPITKAFATPEGWAFSEVAESLRTDRVRNTYLRPTAPASTDPLSLDYASLLSGSTRIAHARVTGDGQDASRSELLEAGVERHLATSWTVHGSQLLVRTVENGALATQRTLDAGKRVVAVQDEAGTTYRFSYDALGRLRRVELPNGTSHTQRFDEHGRVAEVVRDGVARILHEYSATTGLLARTTYSTPSGAAMRRVDYSYDAIGRRTAAAHTDLVAGGSKTYRFFYDGATPDTPEARTDLGQLSAVTGDGFSKVFTHRADGLLLSRTTAITGFPAVRVDLTYFEDGAPRSQSTTLLDERGVVLSRSKRASEVDDFGRLSQVTLNGALLATAGYDGLGLLSAVHFANGDTLTFKYDETTRRLTGSSQGAGAYTASTSRHLNARGLVASETFSVGSTTLARSYAYSDQRFLTGSSDALNLDAYGFDAIGLPTSITANGDARTLTETGTSLTAGRVTYGFDALHRTVSRTDSADPSQELVLTYAADGQVASATRAGVTYHFTYDEAGQRLAKYSGHAPVAAYLEEGYLDVTGLTERFNLGGRTVGIIRDGSYTTIATDLRGSVLAETTGTARIASPFGHRDVHPEMTAALDYVEKGYDADLGWVRMGVRDYDPRIHRFTTPDPLFLESPERCVASPVECSLFGYARNAPVQFVDPSGSCSVTKNGIDCVSAALRTNDAVYKLWREDLAQGNYGLAAVGAGLNIAMTVPLGAGFYMQAFADVTMAGARAFNGFMRGQLMETLEGGAEIGITLLLGKMAGLASELRVAPLLVAEVGGSGIRVTEAGIARIEAHLGRLGALEEPANAAMLERLRAGQTSVQDINFYMHELRESAVMERTGGYGTYEGARAAHLETLQWQNIPYAPGYESQLYHPDVIRAFQDMFNPAAWPQ